MPRFKNLAAFAALAFSGLAQAGASLPPPLAQGFDNVSTLSSSGWVQTNNSTAGGGSAWFQGNAAVLNASAGPANAYIAANFENAPFGGAISNWLITPELNLALGLTLQYDLALMGDGFMDTVEVRFSNAGASANVGASTTSVGDFSILLETTSATVATGWVAHSLVVGPELGTGRLAFRYLVADTSVNGNYIGIDSVQILSGVPEPESYALALLGLAVLGVAVRARQRAGAGQPSDPQTV